MDSKEQKHNEKHTFHHIYPATLPPMLPSAIRTYSSLSLDSLLVADLCLAPRDPSDYTNLSRNPPRSLQAATSWHPSVHRGKADLSQDRNEEVDGFVWGGLQIGLKIRENGMLFTGCNVSNKRLDSTHFHRVQLLIDPTGSFHTLLFVIWGASCPLHGV